MLSEEAKLREAFNSVRGRFVILAAGMEPGKQQELNKEPCSGKRALSVPTC